MNSSRKKILWLVSWYPNRFDKYDGDFIQRHARAASLHNDIHVIAVKEGNIPKEVEEDWKYATGLTEQIIYFRSPFGFFSKFQKQLKWRKLYLNAIFNSIKKNGRPALIHVHVPWKAGLIALELKMRYHLSFIISEHWGIYDPVLEDNYTSKPAIFKTLLSKVYQKSKHLCLPSNYLGTCINKTVLKKKYSIIPNVVDTSLFFYKEQKYSKFTFIHVSNMEPIKNVSGIIDAFAELVLVRGFKDLHLIFIGNRDNSLKTYAGNMGLLDKNLFFKGEIPYTEVARELQLAHCFILNSKMETFSCVTAEALCCGLPVVARNVGSLPEIVNSTNGILVDTNDSLAGAMCRIIEDYDKYDFETIALEAQQKYNYDAIGCLFKKLYDGI
jgi:glycosyltransferase involved in cell wall biosynthesis